MAPPRKPPEPGKTHPIHLRFPTDVFERIDAKAKALGVPVNRVVINEAAQYPYLERQDHLGDVVHDMKVVLAQYGSRIAIAELSEAIRSALNEAVAAPTAAQRQACFDKLLVLHGALVQNERETAQSEREELTRQAALSERKIAAIEALPDSSLDKDRLPALHRETERLKRDLERADLNAATDRKAAE